jgi:dihydrodipicolinate synthase/N-acetylneuraminate lyase
MPLEIKGPHIVFDANRDEGHSRLNQSEKIMDSEVKGLIVPMFTPIKFKEGTNPEDNQMEIDYTRGIALCDQVIKNGADVLFLFGNAGKFDQFTVEQKEEYISAVIKHVHESGRPPVKIVVGVTGEDMEQTCRFAQFTEQAGADAIVFIPNYQKLEDNPERNLKRLLNSTDGPVILYNNPHIQERGNFLPLELISKYADHPKVGGIKDSSGDTNYFMALWGLFHKSGGRVFMGDAKSIPIISEILKKFGFELDGCVPVQANYDTRMFSDYLRKNGVKTPQLTDYLDKNSHTWQTVRQMVREGKLDPAMEKVFPQK